MLLYNHQRRKAADGRKVNTMTIEIFKNYGCLAAEKRAIYTYGAEQPTAVCSDVLTVKIPEGWEANKNECNEIILTAPWGWTYGVNEVLAGNDTPYFHALDSDGRTYNKNLEIVG